MDAAGIAVLRNMIEATHAVMSIHRETVHVDESADGDLVWSDNVEVFDLVGHSGAALCYACPVRDRGRGARYVLVLAIDPVDSPVKAVRLAMASHGRREFRD